MLRRCALRRQAPDHRDLAFVPQLSHLLPVAQVVDLRASMPPVLDQGQVGTCAANATANMLRYLLHKEHALDFAPSRLFLYWNVRVMMGVAPDQDSGSDLRTMCEAVRRFHVADEAAWPYGPEPEKRFKIAPSPVAVATAAKHTKVQYLAVERDLAHVRDCLAQGFPIVMGISVFPSFESAEVAASGVVPMPGASEASVGGHAVLLCGIDSERQVLIVQNSWGPVWGQAGFFTLPFAYLTDHSLTFDLWTYRYFL